jgi:hypothetical protein
MYPGSNKVYVRNEFMNIYMKKAQIAIFCRMYLLLKTLMKIKPHARTESTPKYDHKPIMPMSEVK